MTTHPEDAMTRERALEDIVAAFLERAADQDVLAGHHRTPDERPFCAVRATIWRTAARDVRAALASAQQEPAPSADAAEVARGVAQKLAIKEFYGRDGFAVEIIAAALRRYAGDGGVTWQPIETAPENVVPTGCRYQNRPPPAPSPARKGGAR